MRRITGIKSIEISNFTTTKKTNTMLKSIFIIASILFCVNLHSQDELIESLGTAPAIQIQERDVKVQKSSFNAFSLKVHGKSSDVEKDLVKYFSSRYKADFKKNKGNQEALGVTMSDVINETVTLILLFDEKDGMVTADVVVDLGGKALDSNFNSSAADRMESLLKAFAKEHYNGLYQDVISDQEKNFSKEEKNMAKAVKEGEGLVKSKEQRTEDMAKAEKEITDALAKIEQLKADIEKAKTDVSNLEGEIEKNIKDQETQKSVVEKEQQRLNKLKMAAEGLKK
ncbi:MAG: hypothetical protein NWR73_03780 [Flavobacteriales bacterium]|nr:hypothetical protein [Flavobacteriales bacterium]